MMWTDASKSALDEHMKLPTRADGYVRKPFSPSDLRGQVRAFVPAVEGVPSLRQPNVGGADGWEAGARTVSGLVALPTGSPSTSTGGTPDMVHGEAGRKPKPVMLPGGALFGGGHRNCQRTNIHAGSASSKRFLGVIATGIVCV
jgi:hypothetical protein